MTPEEGARLYGLFSAASELPPDELRKFLDRECGNDSRLRERLERMVAHAGHSGGVLGNGPWNQPPVVKGRVFQVDDMVSDRYRVEGFLGMGGMGEVYAVRDTILDDVRVALKTIRPEYAADEQMLARFRREIQLEREVVHENVCPLYEFARHRASDGSSIHFLTMRFLPGETLARHLKDHGKLEPAEAARIAGQIAAGLDAAHRAGILHRDLKASNIMLVPAGKTVKAVVTDFGLARRMETGAVDLTRTGQLMGVPDYMAPELFKSRPHSASSDVYALGIILYEMLAGHRPFSEDDPNVGVHKRSLAAPRPADDAPEVGPRWTNLVARCLDPEPANRPTLSEFIAALQPDAPPLPLPTSLPKGESRWFSRRSLAVAKIFFLVLSVSVLIWRLTVQRTMIGSGQVIYLTEMNNATQDAQLDSAGLLLRNHLVQSASVRLADESRIARAKSLMGNGADSPAKAREIALRVGAAVVVFSTLVRVADGYQLSVRMEKAASSPSLFSQPVSRDWQVGGKQQIFNVVREAGDFIRSEAGESGQQIAAHDISPDEAASSSWEAIELYRQSEKLVQESRKEAAVSMLERAIEIDPDFALAHIRLADILNGVRRQEEAFKHYQLALGAAGKRRLTRWEELMLRGNYALDTGDYRVAEGAFVELRALYPDRFQPLHYLAAALEFQGRAEESVQLEREAATRDPLRVQPVRGIIGPLIRLGRFAEAEAGLGQLRDLSHDQAVEMEGQIRASQGDFGKAIAAFEVSSRVTDSVRRSRCNSLLAQAFAEKGQYSKAIKLYDAGILADSAAGRPAEAALKHVALASLHLRAGDSVTARNHALESVRVLRSLKLYRGAATILARAGYPADAQRLADDIGPAWPGPLADAARHHIHGEALMQQGRTMEAIREFEAADRLDSPKTLREYLAHAYAGSQDRERALFLYGNITRSRGAFWEYADCELPGIRASMLLESGRLAMTLGDAGRAAESLREYQLLRREADPNLPETAEARRLLSSLE